MGIALYRLAGYLERSDFNDLDQLAVRIEQRQLSAEFMREWDKFLATFGWRGPMEMDLASRSEEHTSELQSLMRISYAVFCLKKKTQKSAIYNSRTTSNKC